MASLAHAASALGKIRLGDDAEAAAAETSTSPTPGCARRHSRARGGGGPERSASNAQMSQERMCHFCAISA